MFGQVLVMRLFRDHGILTQICGNNFMVLKVAPPLVVRKSRWTVSWLRMREVVERAPHVRRLSGAKPWAGAARQ